MAEEKKEFDLVGAVIKGVGLLLLAVCSFLWNKIETSEQRVIELEAIQLKHENEYQQVRSELTDIWGKYNRELKEREAFLKEYYIDAGKRRR